MLTVHCTGINDLSFCHSFLLLIHTFHKVRSVPKSSPSLSAMGLWARLKRGPVSFMIEMNCSCDIAKLINRHLQICNFVLTFILRNIASIPNTTSMRTKVVTARLGIDYLSTHALQYTSHTTNSSQTTLDQYIFKLIYMAKLPPLTHSFMTAVPRFLFMFNLVQISIDGNCGHFTWYSKPIVILILPSTPPCLGDRHILPFNYTPAIKS